MMKKNTEKNYRDISDIVKIIYKDFRSKNKIFRKKNSKIFDNLIIFRAEFIDNFHNEELDFHCNEFVQKEIKKFNEEFSLEFNLIQISKESVLFYAICSTEDKNDLLQKFVNQGINIRKNLIDNILRDRFLPNQENIINVDILFSIKHEQLCLKKNKNQQLKEIYDLLHKAHKFINIAKKLQVSSILENSIFENTNTGSIPIFSKFVTNSDENFSILLGSSIYKADQKYIHILRLFEQLYHNYRIGFYKKAIEPLYALYQLKAINNIIYKLYLDEILSKLESSEIMIDAHKVA